MQQLQRVAIYARVSSEQRTGEDTIASQLAALRARVSSDGQVLPVEQRFVDDGYSGATLVRPALERLRDLAAARWRSPPGRAGACAASANASCASAAAS